MTKPPDFTHANFKTSSYTGNGTDCVEIAAICAWWAVRDSKEPPNETGLRDVLIFGDKAWTQFTAAAVGNRLAPTPVPVAA